MNEDLRTASEELETGRKKLQSINEELSRVNQELKSRMEELGRANSDLDNLMASTAIARNSEEAIRELSAENDARLRTFNAVINSAQDFIYHFDLEGRFTFANQPLLDLWQQPLEEIVGKSFHELKYSRELADALQQQIEEVIATRRPFRGRTPYTSAFGTRHYEYIFTPLMRPDGTVEAVAGVTRDITLQTEAEAALRLSEERLRLIVESARDYAIFSADLERRVTSWNFGAERLLGYAEEEIVGQPADVIFTEEDRAARAPEAEATTATAQGRALDERWHLRKDGSRFWGSGMMMAMHDSSGAVIGLLKIFRDQSEARAAQEALERSRQELWEALQENERARAEVEAAGKAKDHFLAVLSHELRTPLTPVLMAVQTLARRKDLPPAVADALEMIRRNIEVEAHFVDDLLDITRIARGKIEILREPVDLHEVAIRAVEVSAPDMEAKRQQLTVSLDASQHRVRGDATRLQQVFWNLLKNASKFTPEAGQIWMRSRNELERIIVEVSDTGIGIEAEAFSRIFDAFEQAEESVTREFGGLGLGLAISKATIDTHDGTLRVSSPGRNQGSTFAVELPLL